MARSTDELDVEIDATKRKRKTAEVMLDNIGTREALIQLLTDLLLRDEARATKSEAT